MGCTPLNETVVCMLDIVPEFKQRHGIDIVNAVFLTDGEGGTITDYYTSGDKHHRPQDSQGLHGQLQSIPSCRSRNHARLLLCSRIALVATPSVFDCSTTVVKRKQTSCLVSGDTTIVGTFGGDAVRTQAIQRRTALRGSNPCTYDAYFIMKSTEAKSMDLDDVKPKDGKVSVAKIRNAFIKGGTDRKSARIIANKMVLDIFAHFNLQDKSSCLETPDRFRGFSFVDTINECDLCCILGR